MSDFKEIIKQHLEKMAIADKSFAKDMPLKGAGYTTKYYLKDYTYGKRTM